MRLSGWFGAAAGVCGVIALVGAGFGDKQIMYNPSDSVPPGFYLRNSTLGPEVGRLVVFPVPPGGRAYAARRGLPDDKEGFFIKPVVGVAGDEVCSDGETVRLKGEVLGAVQKTDTEGRELPRWTGCRPLAEGELFVFSDRIPTSFDSRYYGPVEEARLKGVYEALWTW